MSSFSDMNNSVLIEMINEINKDTALNKFELEFLLDKAKTSSDIVTLSAIVKINSDNEGLKAAKQSALRQIWYVLTKNIYEVSEAEKLNNALYVFAPNDMLDLLKELYKDFKGRQKKEPHKRGVTD